MRDTVVLSRLTRRRVPGTRPVLDRRHAGPSHSPSHTNLRLSHVALGLLLHATVACSTSGSDSTGGRTTNSAGAVLPTGVGLPDTVRLEEEQRIGHRPDDEFGSVAGLALDALGRLWVLDGKSRQIRIHSADGSLVRAVGRQGAGPGEFAQPASLLAHDDGTVWVDDPGNARVVVMDTAGRVLQQHVLARGCMQARPWPAVVNQHKHYVSVGGANCDMVVRWDHSFTEVARVSAPRDPRPPREIRTPFGSASIPFTGEVLWHPAADSTLWALQTDSYRLSRLTFLGDTIRLADIPFERTSLSAADRQLADAFFDELKSEGVVADRSLLPRDKLAAVSFFVAPDGHLWVERYTEPDQLGHRWDIIDSAALRRRAVVVSDVPLSRFPVPLVYADRVIAATTDSLGAPQVVMLRPRSSRSPTTASP